MNLEIAFKGFDYLGLHFWGAEGSPERLPYTLSSIICLPTLQIQPARLTGKADKETFLSAR